MFQTTRIEVLNLMFHFILALVLIVVYGILTYTGHPDETLKFCVISAIAFFFGSAATGAVTNALKPVPPTTTTTIVSNVPVQPAQVVQTETVINPPNAPPHNGV